MASGVAGGTEEVWNVKELLRRVGGALATEYPNSKEVAWLSARVGVLSGPLIDRVGALDDWLEGHHGALFTVDRSDGKASISLTQEGADRFVDPSQMKAKLENSTAAMPNESNEVQGLAVALRNAVFDELRGEAEKRREEGKLYSGKAGAPPSGS